MKHESSYDHARLWKSVQVRVFAPGNKRSRMLCRRADKGMGFTDAEVDKILDLIAADVEHEFPVHEYELVQVGAGAFNIVWRHRREAPGTQEQGKE